MKLRKVFLGFLVVSNLFVLLLVFGVYFQNNYQTTRMYSTTIGTNDGDLKDKLQSQCGKEIEKVISGKRLEYICNITLDGFEKGSSYILNTKVTIKKSGDGFVIKAKGAMDAKTRYATEAQFCDSCEEKMEVLSGDTQAVFGQVFDIAKIIDQKAASSVVNAKDKYRKKDLKKRQSLLKQKNCKGKWDDDNESFEEYDIDQILECKISKLSRKNPIEKEHYYNNSLKKELWEVALSEDYDLLSPDLLKQLYYKHFLNNLSVKNSTSTMYRYLTWRNSYDGEDLDGAVKLQLNQLISETQKLSGIDQNLKSDYSYLTEKYWAVSNPGLSVPVQNTTINPGFKATVPNQPSLKPQVEDLY